MAKTDVYSWRLAPALKAELEAQAREAGVSLAELLETVTSAWLTERREQDQDDENAQARIRAVVAPLVGSIQGDGSCRSEDAREIVRRRLARGRAR